MIFAPDLADSFKEPFETVFKRLHFVVSDDFCHTLNSNMSKDINQLMGFYHLNLLQLEHLEFCLDVVACRQSELQAVTDFGLR